MKRRGAASSSNSSGGPAGKPAGTPANAGGAPSLGGSIASGANALAPAEEEDEAGLGPPAAGGSTDILRSGRVERAKGVVVNALWHLASIIAVETEERSRRMRRSDVRQ